MTHFQTFRRPFSLSNFGRSFTSEDDRFDLQLPARELGSSVALLLPRCSRRRKETSGVKKRDRAVGEEFVILEDAAMAGVGVKDEFGTRNAAHEIS